MLEDLEDDFEDEYDDDDDVDDEAAEHLSDKKGPSPTVWDFVSPKLDQAVRNQGQEDAFLKRRQRERAKELTRLPKITARQKKAPQQVLDAPLHGRYKTREGLAHYAKQEQWERRKELEALSLAAPVTTGKAELAEQERAKAEAIRLEKERIAEEERLAREEAERLENEKKAKEQQEKTAIANALSSRLTATGWAKVPGPRQTELVEEAWTSSRMSESEIKAWINNRKKQVNGKNASERLEKAKGQVPGMLKTRLDDAIEAAYNVAKAIVDKVEQQQKKADLEADKVLLKAAVIARGASGTTAELLNRVIGMMSLASGTTESIDKAYDRNAITEAIKHWRKLGDTVVGGVTVFNQANLVSALWSPGTADDFSWKDRGQNYERTKNFMATVGKHTVNIHVHPPGKWSHPKSQGYPKG